MGKDIQAIIRDSKIPEYLECERLMNEFFGVVDFCVPNCISQERSLFDGIYERNIPGWKGCCYGNYSDPKYSHSEILIKERKALYSGKKNVSLDKDSCEYHDRNSGCVLETHKNPVCIGYVCDSFSRHCSMNYGIEFFQQEVFFSDLVKERKSNRDIERFKRVMQKNIDMVRAVKGFGWAE